jgi:adenylosuccinate synthase
MVIEPVALMEEINNLKNSGLDTSYLHISDRAHIITPYHKLLDELNEKRLDKNKIGTTKKGIGPAYADKINRCGIRVCDLLDKEVLLDKLSFNIEYINLLLTKIYGSEPIDVKDIFLNLSRYAEYIKPYVCDVSSEVNGLIKEGKKVLFEGAQGAMLDIDFGTYPYVTSSHPTSGGVAIGAGISPKLIDNILGITKAYTTRVGEGPFPTELNDETGEFLRKNGHEYGTTTGRPRRCGWFDAAVVKYSAQINGLTHIALTKLDTLTGIEKLKICTHYELAGKKADRFPASLNDLSKCTPCYEELAGWDDDISLSSSFSALPRNARAYVKRIEELISVKISVISVNPDRTKTIILDSVF